jgi:hypothetical protein
MAPGSTSVGVSHQRQDLNEPRKKNKKLCNAHAIGTFRLLQRLRLTKRALGHTSSHLQS